MSDAVEKMFLEAETSFGLSVLQQFPLNESFVFSPLSIALALSLVHAGAEGETKQEIVNAICKGANDDQLKQHYAFLSNALMNPQNGVTVNLANKAFLNKKFPIKTSYLDTIAKNYNASAENLDFSQAAKSAQVMNDFVNEETRGKIPSIISASDVTPDAAAFLINALYLKADWQNAFEKARTREDEFHVSESVTKKLQFMHSGDVRRDYYADDEVEVLSLKYKDANYSFNIFLPREKFGLAKFVNGLTATKLQDMLSKVSSTLVTVKIPRMKIETSKNLNAMLQAIGVKQIFTNSAELNGISDVATKVSDATHKAIIELDEVGVVAAAVTSIAMCSTMLSPEPRKSAIRFTANRPFFYAITLRRSPIFVGAKMN